MRKAGMDKCTVMPCWAYKCIWLCWHSEAQVGQNFYGMGLRSMTIPAASIALGDVGFTIASTRTSWLFDGALGEYDGVCASQRRMPCARASEGRVQLGQCGLHDRTRADRDVRQCPCFPHRRAGPGGDCAPSGTAGRPQPRCMLGRTGGAAGMDAWRADGARVGARWRRGTGRLAPVLAGAIANCGAF